MAPVRQRSGRLHRPDMCQFLTVGSERTSNLSITTSPIATLRYRSSGDQTISREQLFVIAPMKLDHFPTIDDPCIRTGNKANKARREKMDAKTDESAGK